MRLTNKIRAAALLLASAAAVVGCSSSGSQPNGGGNARSAAVSQAGSHPTTYPNDHLTGIGANRTTWNAHHAANPDPRLDAGCCYGPAVKSPDNGGTADTWNLAGNGPDFIGTVTHNFAPQTSETVALRDVERQDLPADARLMQTVTSDPTCEALVFRSAELAGAAPKSIVGDGSVSVSLYSIESDANYHASDVEQALESIDDDPSC